MKQFDPEKTGLQKYPITEHQVQRDYYIVESHIFISLFFLFKEIITSRKVIFFLQPIYFVTESFEDAKQRMM